MRRILRRLLYACFTFVLLIFLLGYTQYGLKIVLLALQELTPGELKISDSSGTLAKHFTLKNLSYHHADFDFKLKEFYFNWQPKKLFQKKLVINEAVLNHVFINFTTTTKHENQQSFSISELAWLSKVVITHLQLQNLIIQNSHHTLITIKKASIENTQPNHYRYQLLTSHGEMSGQLLLSAQENSWDLTLAARHVNPAFLEANLNGDINFNLQTMGEWQAQNKNVQFKADELSGNFQGFPIKGLVQGGYHNKALTIDNMQLQVADAVMNVKGSMLNAWNLQWQLDVPDAKKLYPSLEGKLISQGELLGPLDHPNISAKFNATHFRFATYTIANASGDFSSLLNGSKMQLNLTAKDIAISEYRIPQLQLALTSKLVDQALKTRVQLALSAKNTAEGEISISPFKTFTDLTQSLTGNLQVDCTQLSDLIEVPYTKKLAGKLQGNIQLSGTLNAPKFAINANLMAGQAYLPDLQTTIENVNAEATYQTHSPVNFKGHFVLGGGNAEVSGLVDIEHEDFKTLAHVKGSDLQVMNSPEYKIFITPDLNIHYSLKGTQIDGQLSIPKARIIPKDFSDVTTLPEEVVIVNQDKPVIETTLPATFSFKINLNLGNDVFIAYKNMRTHLQGNINILQEPHMQAQGNGELHTINGKYKAYGRSLFIKEGRLIYTGNLLTNPGLDIKAIQQFKRAEFAESQSQFSDASKLPTLYTGSNNLTVGINVHGTLSKPNVTFFSEPAGLDQNDILSYLVFGYPRSQIKGASSLALLNNLALGMNTSGPSIGSVTKKIKKIFKLTDFSIGATEFFNEKDKKTESKTTVNIGKKVGKHLSVRYSIGLFDSVSVFSLRYQINKRLAIQSETSTNDTGADLLYEIERD